jgi:hypothetical protein
MIGRVTGYTETNVFEKMLGEELDPSVVTEMGYVSDVSDTTRGT